LSDEGHLLEMVLEGRAIQQRLCNVHNHQGDDTLSENRFAHSFTKLMFAGNIKAALTLPSEHPKGKRLHLDEFMDSFIIIVSPFFQRSLPL